MAELTITINATYDKLVNPILNVNVVGRPVLCATVTTNEPITLTKMGLTVINLFFNKKLEINDLNIKLNLGTNHNFHADIINIARANKGKKFRVWFEDNKGNKHTSSDWANFDVFNK